jgi:hypothetical protein
MIFSDMSGNQTAAGAVAASRSSTLTGTSSATGQQIDPNSQATAQSASHAQNNKLVMTNPAANNNYARLSTPFKETAFVLIKRLLGCLSNINSIKDPNVHKRVIEFIFNKWERLTKVKINFHLFQK